MAELEMIFPGSPTELIPVAAWTLRCTKNGKAFDQRSELGRFVCAVASADLGGDLKLDRAQALLARRHWTFDGQGAADSFVAGLSRPVNNASYSRTPP